MKRREERRRNSVQKELKGRKERGGERKRERKMYMKE
jgi:hypothetical protein